VGSRAGLEAVAKNEVPLRGNLPTGTYSCVQSISLTSQATTLHL